MRCAGVVQLALPALEAALRAAPAALVFGSDDPELAAMQAHSWLGTVSRVATAGAPSWAPLPHSRGSCVGGRRA